MADYTTKELVEFLVRMGDIEIQCGNNQIKCGNDSGNLRVERGNKYHAAAKALKMAYLEFP